ncbi:hypothetical protein [Leucobacter iarius]|uniref:Uncharacterized protein n=1 Tax=Leucobacter iarius TaxID=333963 RepID=A0ABN2L785_9MICO
MTLPELPEATEVDDPTRLSTRTSAHWGLVVLLGAAAVAIFVGLAFWVASLLPETQEPGTECFLHNAQACRITSEAGILSAVEDQARISFPEGTQLVQSESSGSGWGPEVDRSALVRVPADAKILFDPHYTELSPEQLAREAASLPAEWEVSGFVSAHRLPRPQPQATGVVERLPSVVVLEGPVDGADHTAVVLVSE